jgi:hypothetical protein
MAAASSYVGSLFHAPTWYTQQFSGPPAHTPPTTPSGKAKFGTRQHFATSAFKAFGYGFSKNSTCFLRKKKYFIKKRLNEIHVAYLFYHFLYNFKNFFVYFLLSPNFPQVRNEEQNTVRYLMTYRDFDTDFRNLSLYGKFVQKFEKMYLNHQHID